MVTKTTPKTYTLTHEEIDTLVKRTLDHFWPYDVMKAPWMKYISDEDITEWLGDDLAGMVELEEALK